EVACIRWELDRAGGAAFSVDNVAGTFASGNVDLCEIDTDWWWAAQKARRPSRCSRPGPPIRFRVTIATWAGRAAERGRSPFPFTTLLIGEQATAGNSHR